jgi:hypothetical protein
MKNLIVKLILGCVISSSLLVSCSKKNETPNPSPADSRNVKYEITGNAIGGLDLIYTIANGNGGTGAPSANLPFVKEVVIEPGVTSVSFYCALLGDTPGKTITAKIYVGGVLKKEGTAITDANGDAVIPKMTYTFK